MPRRVVCADAPGACCRLAGKHGLFGFGCLWRLGKTKIHNFDEALAVEQQNLGAQVAVEHVLVVGALEPACRLQHYSDGLAGLERPVVANQAPRGIFHQRIR